MKKLLLPLFILTQFVFADPPNWEYEIEPWDYEFTMYMYAAVLDDNGDIVSDDYSDMFAAFGEDGIVRGFGIPMEVPFGPYAGQILWEMTVYSNSFAEVISFKYYDASEGQILSIVEEWGFEPDAFFGDLMNPMFFTTGPPEDQECEEEILEWGNDTFSCSVAVDFYDCFFLWGDTPLYELCPVTCDNCPDECTDVDADSICDVVDNCVGTYDDCNVCEGPGAIYECGCSDAVENYDCDGNCVVDVDCAGTCGGDSALDDCGICDGGNADQDECGECFGDADGTDCNDDGMDDVCEDEYQIGFESGFFEGESTGDINHDGLLNVTDIVIIVNTILY